MKTHSNDRRRIILIVISYLGLAINAGSALATNINWDGGGDGVSWQDRFNWNAPLLPDPNSIPGLSDDVTILNFAQTINVTGQASARTITCQGDITIQPDATLSVASGMSLQGTARLIGNNATNDGGTLYCRGTQTWTSATIVFDYVTNGRSPRILLEGDSTLTLASTVTVHGGSGAFRGNSFFGANGHLVNLGSISSDSPSQSIGISTVSFSNSGSLTVSEGSTLSLNGSWNNSAGTINIVNGTLNLGGTFTSPGLGTISRTGGTVNLMGTLDNTGSTFSLNATTGPWNFVTNGIIKGGTLNVSDPSLLVVSSGTLDGVNVVGNIDVYSYTTLYVSNGLALSGIIHLILQGGLAGVGGTLQFVNTQTMSSGTIFFDRTDTSHGGAGPQVVIPSGVTLTLGPAVTVRGGNGGFAGIPFNGQGSLINQGLISADMPGQFLNVSNFTNQGTMQVFTGSTLSLGGTWTNANGTISIVNGTLNMSGSFTSAGLGTISRTGGTVNLMGTLDNTGSTFSLNASTGPWNFALSGNTAVIKGGTLNISDPSMLVFSWNGTLDGVSVVGDISVPPNRTLFVSNGLALAGTIHLVGTSASSNAGGNLQFTNSQTMTSGGIAFESPGTGQYPRITVPSGVALTLAPDVAVHGGYGRFVGAPSGGQGTLINQGLIWADVPGQSLYTSLTGFTNSGSIRIGTGSTLSVAGSYNQDPLGVLQVEIAGPIPGSQFGQFMISGAASLDGSLNPVMVNGYIPSLIDAFKFLTYASRTGTFMNINGMEICSGRSLGVVYHPTDATLIVQAPTFAPGDLDHNNVVDSDDLTIFVSVLLGTDLDGNHSSRADMNCDGSPNGRDIQPFVNTLLGS